MSYCKPNSLVFLLFLMSINWSFSQDQSAYQVAVLKYKGGGDWYSNPTALPNLMKFCNKNLDKRQGSSDWNKDLEDLSDKQLEYAANDVIYLHKIKDELEKMLIRENRMDLFKSCISFLDTRIELDQSGFKFDIFEH